MMNEPPPVKDLNVRIPSIIPVTRRGFVNHGSGLGLWALLLGRAHFPCLQIC